MGLISAIFDKVNERGKTFIVNIKQDLISEGKSATGNLVKGTKGTTKVSGTKVIFEGVAPDYYIFVDKGRRAGAKMPPIKHIQQWIKQKGLDLNAFAVAKSIAKKGIKPTRIYTRAVEELKAELDLSGVVSKIITQEIKNTIK